ncbi:hypothetical protein CJ231_02050 [Hoylesella buccalis]|uniref:Uncharacterized protein n=1 Tax=Hoylesella buccalis TaxID=28127 RepID=A0A2N6QU44_9BACT|nr:hypothetical protein CJ231_02050 [Hoylesella buccalis]
MLVDSGAKRKQARWLGRLLWQNVLTLCTYGFFGKHAYRPWSTNPLFLSCDFTQKRPLEIFKIEKINRQAVDKSTLI